MRGAGLIARDTDERWADLDRRAPWVLSDGGTVTLVTNVPGTRDYPDLRRAARIVQLDDRTRVAVAHPRDIVRMADASPRESERARVPGLRALLSRLDKPAGHA